MSKTNESPYTQKIEQHKAMYFAAGYPVGPDIEAHLVLSKSGKVRYWRIICPACNRENQHGAGLPGESKEECLSSLGHRGSHCGCWADGTGYYLVKSDSFDEEFEQCQAAEKRSGRRKNQLSAQHRMPR